MEIDKQASNLAHWISEFPKQARFMTHPSRIGFFFNEPPPIVGRRVPDDEWRKIVKNIRRSRE